MANKKTLSESLREVLGKPADVAETEAVIEAELPKNNIGPSYKDKKPSKKPHKTPVPDNKMEETDIDNEDVLEITQEEYDNLDAEDKELFEISKKTLGSYVKAASKDVGSKTRAKTDATVTKNLSRSPRERGRAEHEKNKAQRSLNNRSTGIGRAVDRLTKEETEMTDKEIDETTAADTLHPAAQSIDDPKSKFSMISNAIGAMNAMSSDELTKWYTSSIAQSKTYNDKIPGGAAASNVSTLNMKPSHAKGTSEPHTKYPTPHLGVKEDVEEMLAGFELTEESRDEITTLFEAVVTARVIVENARLEEEFETKLEEAITTVSEDLADQIDNYLTYVVEHFIEENEVAIESSLRNELVSEFIDGMKNLFTEHYIEVPESKVDVVEALSDKVTELEGKFDEQLDENKQLREALVEVEREKLVDTYLEGLALSQADKFLKLVEGVDFDGNLETYSKKLSIVKENYFSTAKKKVPAGSTNIVEESFEGDTKTVGVDPTIARIMESINRSYKP